MTGSEAVGTPESRAGKDRDGFHLNLRDRADLRGVPNLVPLARWMKDLAKLANRAMSTGGLSDGPRRPALLHLELEIGDAVGAAAFPQFCYYVVLM